MVLYGLYGPVWSHMVPYSPQYFTKSLIIHNSGTLSSLWNPSHMTSVWSSMVLYGHVWSNIGSSSVRHSSVWSHVILYCLLWPRMIPYGPAWSRKVPNGPISSIMVIYGPIWQSIFLSGFLLRLCRFAIVQLQTCIKVFCPGTWFSFQKCPDNLGEQLF